MLVSTLLPVLMMRVRANGGAKRAVVALLSDEFVEQIEQSEKSQHVNQITQTMDQSMTKSITTLMKRTLWDTMTDKKAYCEHAPKAANDSIANRSSFVDFD